MEERRRMIRRQSDRALLERIQELQVQVDRRGEKDGEAEHARRRTIRHTCKVAISMKVGVSSGYADTWDTASIRVKGRILDLSAGGTSLFTEQRFETGQQLELAISLRDRSEIRVTGAVRWVKMVPQKGGFASGVQFTQVPEKDRAKIVRFLQELDSTAGL